MESKTTKVKLRIWMKSGNSFECRTITSAKDTRELYREILGEKLDGYNWFCFMGIDERHNFNILLNEVEAIEYLGEVKDEVDDEDSK